MQAAEYRGSYLIISNRYDLPYEALAVYVKRWRIEVFYRAAKQELGLSDCHSTTETEIHDHAHLELLFATETLLNLLSGMKTKEKRVMENASPTAKWSAAFSTLVVRSG